MKTLKYAWRFLVRSKSYTVINIVGLSLSLACTIILVRYIHLTHCPQKHSHQYPEAVYIHFQQ